MTTQEIIELVKNANINEEYWIDELDLENKMDDQRALGYVEAKISELHESESSYKNEYFRECLIEWLEYFL